MPFYIRSDRIFAWLIGVLEEVLFMVAGALVFILVVTWTKNEWISMILALALYLSILIWLDRRKGGSRGFRT